MREAHFSHIENDRLGMVDISHKEASLREALALAHLRMPAAVMDELSSKGWQTAKGPVFYTAVIAATLAVKNTASLIPFCHAIHTDDIKVSIAPSSTELITIEVLVKSRGSTGVEMEALMGASIAALTIYDMCKSLSHEMIIENTRLIKKTGGKSDYGADSR